MTAQPGGARFAPRLRRAERRVCGCGHARRYHEHYRPGTECIVCVCTRFRWRWLSPLRLLD
jgi:hypothetical protein